MASMAIAWVRMVFREVRNPFIGHLRHIPGVVVCVVPEVGLVFENGKTLR